MEQLRTDCTNDGETCCSLQGMSLSEFPSPRNANSREVHCSRSCTLWCSYDNRCTGAGRQSWPSVWALSPGKTFAPHRLCDRFHTVIANCCSCSCLQETLQ